MKYDMIELFYDCDKLLKWWYCDFFKSNNMLYCIELLCQNSKHIPQLWLNTIPWYFVCVPYHYCTVFYLAMFYQNSERIPPPWLIAMQRYGPPPSYPTLKVPGLNAPIPEGCAFGYHAGGWGKPPVDENGKPLYGDVFGTTAADLPVSIIFIILNHENCKSYVTWWQICQHLCEVTLLLYFLASVAKFSSNFFGCFLRLKIIFFFLKSILWLKKK